MCGFCISVAYVVWFSGFLLTFDDLVWLDCLFTDCLRLTLVIWFVDFCVAWYMLFGLLVLL